MVFLRFAKSLKISDTVFVLTGGGPGISTQSLTLYTHQERFKKFNLGYMSAISFLCLILVVIASTIYVAVLEPQLERRT